MKLKKIVQIIMVGCSILAVGGCTSTAKHNNMMASAGTGEQGAEATGIGEGENFGDTNGTGGSSRHASNKNVYYFDFDKSEIRAEDKPAILSKADQLAGNPKKKIILEGHTDPRGSREYNVALGERRANSVAELMKSKGVSRDQVRVVSYGAEHLAADGRNEQDYQLDRRAVIDTQG